MFPPSKATSHTLQKLKTSLTSNRLAKCYNTVYKEGSKIRKGAGSVSRNDSKKKAAKPKTESNQEDDVSYLDDEYTVPESSYNGNYNDSYQGYQYRDTSDL